MYRKLSMSKKFWPMSACTICTGWHWSKLCADVCTSIRLLTQYVSFIFMWLFAGVSKAVPSVLVAKVWTGPCKRYDMLFLRMGTNAENGIQIFGIAIPIYLNICFGRSCLCQFGRSFLCPGTGHIGILVQYTINLRCGKFDPVFL